MKVIVVLLATILLTVAPAQAQPSTPQPSSPVSSSQVLQVLDEMTQRLEVLSTTDATTANAAVLLLGAGFFVLTLAALAVAVWFIRYGTGWLKPLFDTIHSERQRAVTAEQSETRMQIISDDKERELQKLRTQQAEALERLGTIMSGMETSEQARKERKDAVQVVNDHTSAESQATRREIKAVRDKLDEVMDILRKRIGDEPLVEELEDVKQRVVKLVDTAPLNPDTVPEQDPAASKDIWEGDNPDISDRPEGKEREP